MIVLLGASGYVGGEFVRFFEQQQIDFRTLSRSDCDYYHPQQLAQDLEALGAGFVINCAGYTGKPNVDACEHQRTDCLQANAVLPGRINQACELADIPWGHVSSGCIYNGPAATSQGFREDDPPNFSFRQNNCSFYSGCKALGEEVLKDTERCYIWRLRIPFDHLDSPRNYLSKVMRYDRLLDARNSLSELGEFVRACYQCWSTQVPFGTYNLTNGGSVTTREVADMIRRAGISDKEFDFFESESEFMREAAITPRSNTVLDNSKALAAGLNLSPVTEAIERALKNWSMQPAGGVNRL